ncbi:hypothetical protein Sjap_013519 [Stephania japonica]|uniref:Legume lectin domain-containing protein n=1 Tax=Stephania japonica TaxID=461633 RepID=A0AAP0J016_9MAGN
MQVWIDYDAVKKRVVVALAPMGVTRPRIPLLSTHLDLSLVFMDQMYVGFSASNGLLQSSQYILGWSFNIDGQAQKLDITRLPPVPRRKQPKERHGQTIGSTVGMVMVALITLFGGLYIVRRKRYDEIREDWEKEYGPQRSPTRICTKPLKLSKIKPFFDQVDLGRFIEAPFRNLKLKLPSNAYPMNRCRG